jgi:hypothetical protein
MLNVKSIVLTSTAPDTTAAFYRDIAELPLEQERHRGTDRHWACQVGNLHFAIHDRDTFWLPSSDGGATIVSFTVPDLDAISARLAAHNIEIIARTKIGPMSFLAVRDPDGRNVCFGTAWPGPR